MQTNKIVYWISTLIICGIMLFSASMYLTKHEMVKGFFVALGYPTYLIYPMATAKILGAIAILSNQSKTLKEWAYAGFFFNGLLATFAHIHAHDGGYLMAGIFTIMVIVSKIFNGLTTK